MTTTGLLAAAPRRSVLTILALVLAAGCPPEPAAGVDASVSNDADGGQADAAILDATGLPDLVTVDRASPDLQVPDDAGRTEDGSTPDAALTDAGPPNQDPVGAITAPATDVETHQGTTVAFAATCTDPDGDQPLLHQWTFSDGTSSSAGAFERRLDLSGVITATHRCSDARGGISAASTRSVRVTNAAPVIDWVEPADGAVLLTGSQLLLDVGCSDSDDPAELSVQWTLDSAPLAGSGTQRHLVFASPTVEHVVQVRCRDPFGLEASATRHLAVADPPAALYLSTEQQLAYPQLMWAPTPGAPVVLNQPLFAPGGTIGAFVLAAGDVYYTADHTIQDRPQLFRANPSDRSAPYVVTAPVYQGSIGELRANPDGSGFAFRAQQDAANQWDLFWVDATVASPQAVHLNPPLAMGQDAQGYLFSRTGRYVAFWIQDSSYDIYIADLATGDEPVLVLADAPLLRPPVAFSADDSLAVVASPDRALALELATLHQPTPHLVEFYSAGSNRIVQAAFVGPHALVAYVARGTLSSSLPSLRVVDLAAALSGVDELNVQVFTSAAVEGSSSGSEALWTCGATVVFSAEVNTYYHELYAVDLVQWVADYRALHGSQAAPVRLSEEPSGTETAQVPGAVFTADCSALVISARIDHDDDVGTPEVWALQIGRPSSPGAPQTVATGGSYSNGGQYPGIAFAPDGQTLMWTEGVLDRRSWVSAVDVPAPLQVAASLQGGLEEALWLDSERLLLAVTGSDDAGLYLWDRTDPGSPLRLSPEVADPGLFVLGDDRATVVYRSDFTSTARRIAQLELTSPGLSSVLSGDGTTNGARIWQALLADQGQTAVFTAHNENKNQTHVYAVDPELPGVATTLSPTATDPAASVGELSYAPATDLLVYRVLKAGLGSLYTSSPGAPGPALAHDLTPAESLTEVLAVAPSGDRVLYVATHLSESKTYLRSLVDPGAAVELSATRASSSYRSLFSPSGRYAAFISNTTPARAYLVDTDDLGAGAVPLTPPSLPDELPSSSENTNLVATQGSRAVAFSEDEAWVYFAHDDVYAGHLVIVRQPLPALDATVRVSGPVTGADKIHTWLASDDGRRVVYRKGLHDAQGQSTTVLLVVDEASPGVEHLVSPALDAQPLRVSTFALLGDFVSMRAEDPSSTASHLYVAALDRATAAWRVDGELASDANLAILGVSAIGAADYVAYSAQQLGEAAPSLHVARRQGSVVDRFDLGPDSPDRVVAAPSIDGRWLWSAPVVAGSSDGLHIMALSAPTATSIRVSGVPIATGRVELPAASR